MLQDPFSSLNAVHTVRYHLERPLKLHRRTGGAKELDEQAKSSCWNGSR